jgi:hypothetical protein
MAEDMVINQGNVGGNTESMEASLDARVEAVMEQAGAAPELAGPPMFWDIVAFGPYQVPSLMPGRLIDVGEQAMISVLVYLNPNVPNPAPGQNACDIITGFGGKIELSFVTSNTQTMQPVPELSHTHCIYTTPGTCWYRYYWYFTPRNPACLYETNICARICNCNNYYVRQYSGFARWTANLDYDLIFGGRRWQFDHPIRYMVSDPKDKCDCPPPPQP